MLVRTLRTIQGRRNRSFVTRRYRKPTTFFMAKKRFYAQPRPERRSEEREQNNQMSRDVDKSKENKQGWNKNSKDMDKQNKNKTSMGESMDKQNKNKTSMGESMDKQNKNKTSMGESMDKQNKDQGSKFGKDDRDHARNINSMGENMDKKSWTGPSDKNKQGHNMGKGSENVERSSDMNKQSWSEGQRYNDGRRSELLKGSPKNIFNMQTGSEDVERAPDKNKQDSNERQKNNMGKDMGSQSMDRSSKNIEGFNEKEGGFMGSGNTERSSSEGVYDTMKKMGQKAKETIENTFKDTNNEDRDQRNWRDERIKTDGQGSPLGRGSEDMNKQIPKEGEESNMGVNTRGWDKDLRSSMGRGSENMDKSSDMNKQGHNMGRGSEDMEKSSSEGLYDKMKKIGQKAKEFVEETGQKAKETIENTFKDTSKEKDRDWNNNKTTERFTGSGMFSNTNETEGTETSRMAKMMTMVGTQAYFVDAMKSLIELEYDAVESYKAAIDKLSSEEYKNKMNEFLNDHNRHIQELREIMSKNGEQAPEGPDMKQYLTKGKVFMAQVGGDHAILTAMLSNEGETNVAYERMINHDGMWDGASDILHRAFEDEKKHATWIKTILKQD